MKILFGVFSLATMLLIAWTALFSMMWWFGDPSCDPQSGLCPSGLPEGMMLLIGVPWACWLVVAGVLARRLRRA